MLGLFAIGALWLASSRARIAVLGVLAPLWSWTGGVYHILHFAKINRAVIAFGALFIAEAIIFLVYAARGRGLELSRDAPARLWAWLLILYALLAYPLLGALSCHVYPAAPMFGVTPCPLVIFTFGMLLFSRARAPWPLFVVPALWSVIGASAAFLLDVYPD